MKIIWLCIKIGHLIGLGSKVHGSRFRVNRFANFSEATLRQAQGGELVEPLISQGKHHETVNLWTLNLWTVTTKWNRSYCPIHHPLISKVLRGLHEGHCRYQRMVSGFKARWSGTQGYRPRTSSFNTWPSRSNDRPCSAGNIIGHSQWISVQKTPEPSQKLSRSTNPQRRLCYRSKVFQSLSLKRCTRVKYWFLNLRHCCQKQILDIHDRQRFRAIFKAYKNCSPHSVIIPPLILQPTTNRCRWRASEPVLVNIELESSPPPYAYLPARVSRADVGLFL